MAIGAVNVGQAPQKENDNYVTQDQIGVPGGLASLDDSGKLAAGQLPAIDHYSRSETDNKIRDAVSAHNSAADAHPAIQASVNSLKATVQAIELKYGTSIKENAFQVSFKDLDSVNVTGVWNQPLATIEF